MPNVAYMNMMKMIQLNKKINIFININEKEKK